MFESQSLAQKWIQIEKTDGGHGGGCCLNGRSECGHLNRVRRGTHTYTHTHTHTHTHPNRLPLIFMNVQIFGFFFFQNSFDFFFLSTTYFQLQKLLSLLLNNNFRA
jgi:hypothetical protein